MENVNGAYYIPIAVSGDISDHARNLTLQSSLWDESVRSVEDHFEYVPILQSLAWEFFSHLFFKHFDTSQVNGSFFLKELT
jgi:hypothetical protein